MSNAIDQLSIKELLCHGEYIIPMYQRNYAWDEGEITQLIQDVLDDMPSKRNYYIGTLVVFERPDGNLETIDGQQRLTTLSLLVSFLKNTKEDDFSWYKRQSIHFESREQSRKTLDAIFDGQFKDDPAEVMNEHQINTAILNGYRLIKKILPRMLKSSAGYAEFSRYLLTNVQIMRVKVPYDTDLNHYFEIMNNRGEQLEKHEVLKSRMMEALNAIEDEAERKESQNCLHVVWEACANMERYVQMGFTPEQRTAVFGDKDWGRFEVDSFDALRHKLAKLASDVLNNNVSLSLKEIVEKAQAAALIADKDEEASERFNTVINFPNFLLHVLRVQTKKDVPLDDKRLISTFESNVLKADDAIAQVKMFILNLLRCKYLFDKYVIKREFIKGADGWSLKRLKWNAGGESSRSGRAVYVNTFGDDDGNEGDNRRLLMLQSAFHVSTPTMVYKHWLNAALFYLFETESIEPEAYLRKMESVAQSFVFGRFLVQNEPEEYYDIVYNNKLKCESFVNKLSDDKLAHILSFGEIQNNFVFNYLDYLLWLKHSATYAQVRTYEFTFRSSVEHYYPQNPMAGYDRLPPETLNSFGNLCLISHSKNSRLSNFMPEAKKEYYKVNPIDSVKQFLMMQIDHWDANSIADHYKAVKAVLLSSHTDLSPTI